MIRKDIYFYIINCTVIFSALAVYFVIFLNLKVGVNHEVMFSTLDSNSYLHVANGFKDGYIHGYTVKRPILYPIILLFTIKSIGIHSLWIFQVIMWLLTMVLIFWSVVRLTKNYFFAYIIVLFVCCNLSLIVLTLHALTEISVTFLLALLVYFIVRNIKNYNQLFFIYGCLGILVLLTLIKPVFNIPLLFTLFILLPLFHFKKFIQSPLRIFTLLLIIIPYLTQISIMKMKHNTYNVSLVAGGTFTNYLFAQGVGEIENIDRSEAQQKARATSKAERFKYLLEHKSVYVSNFFNNIKENIQSKALFLSLPKEAKYYHKDFSEYMYQYNTLTYYIHLIFLLPVLFLFYIFFKKKNWNKIITLSILSFLCYYFISVTGISFFQGDRLVLPSISIWTCLYAFAIYNCTIQLRTLRLKQYKLTL